MSIDYRRRMHRKHARNETVVILRVENESREIFFLYRASFFFLSASFFFCSLYISAGPPEKCIESAFNDESTKSINRSKI